jgi:hypothetical protein
MRKFVSGESKLVRDANEQWRRAPFSLAGRCSAIAAVVLVSLTLVSRAGTNGANAPRLQNVVEQQDVAVDSFQVLELPLNIIDAAFTHPEKGNLLRCTLANNTPYQLFGLRYLLLQVDSNGKTRASISRNEGFNIPGYGSKTLTFGTPVKLKLKSGYRLALMLEQVVGKESIWEVLKSKDTLEAYASGDYSVMPQVLRVGNQVDMPPRTRAIY